MENAEPLNLGPIVGHTTYNSVRVWGRGEERDGMRCQGVAQIWTVDNKQIASEWCRMGTDYDYTGIVDFNNLTAQTRYICRFGIVYTNVEEGQMGDSSAVDLKECSIADFKTMPDSDFDNISFVFGSCRYMRLNEKSGRSDKAFRSILKQMESGTRTDCVLMAGDQIYSDMGGPKRTDAETVDEYRNRYHKAFGTIHIRKLMSRCPTYMAMDDHDITNNWAMDRLHDGSDDIESLQNQFGAAMNAYHSYQLIHSPAFVRLEDKLISDRPEKLYYQFDLGSSRFFVMDVRTERYEMFKQMISNEQMESLKNWMLSNRENLKFIVSAVPFFPDIPKFLKEDRWTGFVEQRKEILDFIKYNNIKRVVFLGGDVHRTMWSTLIPDTASTVKIHSIVSSPFHWWHLPSPPEFVWQKEGPLVGAEDYRVVSSKGFIKDDNFTRVSRNNDSLKIEVYHRKGKLLEEDVIPL